MVSQSQSEIKKLLSQQLSLEISKTITTLITGISATILIPLTYNSISNDNHKLINLCGFLGGVTCFSYAYFSSNKINEYQGKLKMFNELEKQRFIREQVLSQEVYLSQLESQFLPVFSNTLESQSVPVPDISQLPEASQLASSDNQSLPVSQSVNDNQSTLICPNCQSINISKNGKRDNFQKLICKDCNHNFQIQLRED